MSDLPCDAIHNTYRLTSKKHKGLFEIATNIFQKDGSARVYVLRAQVHLPGLIYAICVLFVHIFSCFGMRARMMMMPETHMTGVLFMFMA
jgi:hypothetical protein